MTNEIWWVSSNSETLITNKQSEDAYYEALISKMQEKKEELLTPVEVTEMLWWEDVSYLNKKAIEDHMNIWISNYLLLLQKIHIKNVMSIKVNQDVAKELIETIEKATTDEEAYELNKSLAKTLENIDKLKLSIDKENVDHLLKEYVETIKQFSAIISKL